MDHRLVAWARKVKARQRRGARPAVPPLWLFTDSARLPDPRPAVAALPRGWCGPQALCGVVFRHDGAPNRAELARALARQCRALRIPMVVAGNPRLAAAVGAGVHLRGGREQGPGRWRRKGALLTSSAHGAADLRRAAAAGAAAAFLSPVFPTPSHPGAPALGVWRWAALARRASIPALALGGVNGATVARLPQRCKGLGAISALLASAAGPAVSG